MERLEKRSMEWTVAKKQIEKRRLCFEEKKFWFGKAEQAFAAGSGASGERTKVVCAMMQRRVIASYQNIPKEADINCTLSATDSAPTENSGENKVVRTTFETFPDAARLATQNVFLLVYWSHCNFLYLRPFHHPDRKTWKHSRHRDSGIPPTRFFVHID